MCKKITVCKKYVQKIAVYKEIRANKSLFIKKSVQKIAVWKEFCAKKRCF